MITLFALSLAILPILLTVLALVVADYRLHSASSARCSRMLDDNELLSLRSPETYSEWQARKLNPNRLTFARFMDECDAQHAAAAKRSQRSEPLGLDR